MSSQKSRRELYSEATRTALRDTAAEMFAARGYGGTSLDDIATASQVTRGAVYHHFANKQALFEAVLELMEEAMEVRVMAAAAQHHDPWDASLAAIDAFLDECCEPMYGRLCWLEGPIALGWEGWKDFEEKHAYGLIERFIAATIAAGLIAPAPVQTSSQLIFHLFGGAGRIIAEAPAATKREVRDECAALIKRMITGLRAK